MQPLSPAPNLICSCGLPRANDDLVDSNHVLFNPLLHILTQLDRHEMHARSKRCSFGRLCYWKSEPGCWHELRRGHMVAARLAASQEFQRSISRGGKANTMSWCGLAQRLSGMLFDWTLPCCISHSRGWHGDEGTSYHLSCHQPHISQCTATTSGTY